MQVFRQDQDWPREAGPQPVEASTMVGIRWTGLITGIALLGGGMSVEGEEVSDDGPPALEGPVSNGLFLPDTASPGNAPAKVGTLHEAFLGRGASPELIRAPKSPPAPIVERPTEDRPNPQAQWLSGYWAWDPGSKTFSWVGGAWRIPPKGMLWVNGRWQRDAEGWSRVPGFWSARQSEANVPDQVLVQGPRTISRAPAARPSVDWRVTGPPTDHPADEPGQAPGPDAFYVPGHYAPVGESLVWKSGFWSRSQSGYDWVPARWVRRADGWDFRAGSWVPIPSSDATLLHQVSRPRSDLSDLPPAIVDSQPARADRELKTASKPVDSNPTAEDANSSVDGKKSTTSPTTAVAPNAPLYQPNPPPNGSYGPPPPRQPTQRGGRLAPFGRRILGRRRP